VRYALISSVATSRGDSAINVNMSLIPCLRRRAYSGQRLVR
jgi:hypothetical protein